MYPARELRILAERRGLLQRRIARRREECVAAGQGVADGVERMLFWGRVLRTGGLLGAVGTGLLALRRRRAPAATPAAGGKSWVARVLRWAPLAFRVFRLISAFG
jgi:hypothetical protein